MHSHHPWPLKAISSGPSKRSCKVLCYVIDYIVFKLKFEMVSALESLLNIV
jgi:hypothetical protein